MKVNNATLKLANVVGTDSEKKKVSRLVDSLHSKDGINVSDFKELLETHNRLVDKK